MYPNSPGVETTFEKECLNRKRERDGHPTALPCIFFFQVAADCNQCFVVLNAFLVLLVCVVFVLLFLSTSAGFFQRSSVQTFMIKGQEYVIFGEKKMKKFM